MKERENLEKANQNLLDVDRPSHGRAIARAVGRIFWDIDVSLPRASSAEGQAAQHELALNCPTLYHCTSLQESGRQLRGDARHVERTFDLLHGGIIVRIRGREARAEATLCRRGYEALGWIVYSLGKGRKCTCVATKVEEVGERVWVRTVCPTNDGAVGGEDVRVEVGRADPACGRETRDVQRLPARPEGVLDEVENAAEVVDVFLLLVWAGRLPWLAASSGNVAA